MRLAFGPILGLPFLMTLSVLPAETAFQPAEEEPGRIEYREVNSPEVKEISRATLEVKPYPESLPDHDRQASEQWLAGEVKVLEKEAALDLLPKFLATRDHREQSLVLLRQIRQVGLSPEAAKSRYDAIDWEEWTHAPSDQGDYDFTGSSALAGLRERAQFCNEFFGPEDRRTRLAQIELSHAEKFFALPRPDQLAVDESLSASRNRTFDEILDLAALKKQRDLSARLLGENDIAVLRQLESQASFLLDDGGLEAEETKRKESLSAARDLFKECLKRAARPELAGYDPIHLHHLLFWANAKLGDWDEARAARLAGLKLTRTLSDPVPQSVDALLHETILLAAMYERGRQYPAAALWLEEARLVEMHLRGETSEKAFYLQNALDRVNRLAKLTPGQLAELDQALDKIENHLNAQAQAAFSREQLLGRPNVPEDVNELWATWQSVELSPSVLLPLRRESTRRFFSEDLPEEFQGVPVSFPVSLDPAFQVDPQFLEDLNALEKTLRQIFPNDPLAPVRVRLASGSLHSQAGHTDAAIAQYQQALDEIKQTNPPLPELLSGLRKEIDWHRTESLFAAWNSAQWGEATTLAEERLKWRADELGERHWMTVDARRDRDLAARYQQLEQLGPGQIEELQASEAEAFLLFRSDLGSGPGLFSASDDRFYVREQVLELSATMLRRNRLLDKKDPFTHFQLAAIASLEIYRGNFDKANGFFSSALRSCETSCGKYHPDYMDLLEASARLAALNSDPEKAANLMATARAIGNRIGRRQWIEYHAQTKTMTIQVVIGSPNQQIRGLEDKFEEEMENSQYVQAETIARDLITLVGSVHGKDSFEAVLASSNLASLWAETGDFVQAELRYAEILKQAAKFPNADPIKLAILKHNLAVVESRLGRLEPAADSLKVVIEQTAKLMDPSEAPMRANRARILRRLGRLEEASTELTAARKLVDQLTEPDPRTDAFVWTETALVDALFKDSPEAEATLKAAEKELPSEERSLETQQDLGYAKGVLHFRAGRPNEAIDEFLSAVRLALAELDVSCEFQTPRQQVAAALAAREYLDALLTVAEQHPERAKDIYDVVPSFKGVALQVASSWRSSLNDPRFADSLNEIREIQNQIFSLSEDISQLRLRIAPEAPRPEEGQPAPRTEADLAAEMEKLRLKQETLERSLAKTMAQHSADRPRDSLRQIAEALPKEAVLVDLVCFHAQPWMRGEGSVEHLVAFVVRPDGMVKLVPLGADADVAQSMKTWANTRYSATLKGGQEARKALRAKIWEPIERELTETEQLVLLSPDGAVTLVPFAALPGRREDQFLIEESRRIVQLPTPLLLLEKPTGEVLPAPLPVSTAQPFDIAPSPALELLLVGDLSFGPLQEKEDSPPDERSSALLRLRRWKRLPNALEEVLTLREYFETAFPDPGAEYRLLIKGFGSEKNVVDWMKTARHVHFATHGFFGRDFGRVVSSNHDWYPERNEDAPDFGPVALASLYPGLFSGLALADANEPKDWAYNDGLLTASEISQLDLSRIETVVLSACETALGDYERGEGQMGVQWAFHKAGAKTCVSSLWTVPDYATSRLMKEFYKHLWSGKGKLESLREAQIWALHNPDELLRGLDPLVDSQEPLTRLPPFYWASFTLSGEWR